MVGLGHMAREVARLLPATRALQVCWEQPCGPGSLAGSGQTGLLLTPCLVLSCPPSVRQQRLGSTAHACRWAAI